MNADMNIHRNLASWKVAEGGTMERETINTESKNISAKC